MSLLRTLSFIALHPLTRDRPMAGFVRFARWQIESRLKREVEFQWIEGAKLLVRNGMTGASGNIYCGLHEFADMAFLLHLLRPGDLFVDVGANVGSYTVLASAVCGADTIAMEPDPGTMGSLRRNIEINGISGRVIPIEAAAGARVGATQFTVGLDTVNRVTADTDAQTRQVEMRRLDDILRDRCPVLIKLDVEGFEGEVVAGVAETLRKPSLLAIATESRARDVIEPLVSAGFREMYYEPFTRRLLHEPNHRHANALYVRNENACSGRLKGAPVRDVHGHRL